MFKPFALASLSLLALATPAFAGTTSVSYRDLDLARPADFATLHQRVARAVDQVVGQADIRDVGVQSAVAHNRAVAMAAAETQMQTAVAAAQGSARLASITPATTAAGL